MKNILCLTDSLDNISNFVKHAQVFFFQIEQLEPEDHNFAFFRHIFEKLKSSVDFSKIDLIIAEYIEALPLVYFMRKEGFYCPCGIYSSHKCLSLKYSFLFSSRITTVSSRRRRFMRF